MQKALGALLCIALVLVFVSSCAADGCPNTGRCFLTLNLAVLATRKQQGSRKTLSFNYAPGCKVCAEHTLGVIA
jgi:outer membrane lipoprotein-sorting protein